MFQENEETLWRFFFQGSIDCKWIYRVFRRVKGFQGINTYKTLITNHIMYCSNLFVLTWLTPFINLSWVVFFIDYTFSHGIFVLSALASSLPLTKVFSHWLHIFRFNRFVSMNSFLFGLSPSFFCYLLLVFPPDFLDFSSWKLVAASSLAFLINI